LPDTTQSNREATVKAGPSWRECLRERAAALADLSERERRHADLMETHEARAVASRAVLEMAYELAQEEGVDPALALELVSCRVAVLELEPPTGASTEESHSLVAPEWVAPADAPLTMAIERRMRMTFRRVRADLEKHDQVIEAIDAFTAETDVGPFDYSPPLL
jgi:hypothetical protein